MKSQLSLIRRIFLITFILAALWLCVSSLIVVPASSGGPSEKLSLISIYASLSTSIITFLGFLITTFLSFRKEKRETREAGLTQKQKEIELERARLELEQLKKQINKKK